MQRSDRQPNRWRRSSWACRPFSKLQWGWRPRAPKRSANGQARIGFARASPGRLFIRLIAGNSCRFSSVTRVRRSRLADLACELFEEVGAREVELQHADLHGLVIGSNDLRPSHCPVPGHRPCRIARFARGAGIRKSRQYNTGRFPAPAICGVETASLLHLKTGLKFDIAYRNPLGRRAGRTGFDWVAGPVSPQLGQRLAFIIYTGLEIRRLGAGRSRRLFSLTHAFDIGFWQGSVGRDGQMRQEGQSADTCEMRSGRDRCARGRRRGAPCPDHRNQSATWRDPV
jgi:hypothetical protein